MSTGLGTLSWPFPGLGSTMDPQAYHIPTSTITHTLIPTVHLYQHTLISTITLTPQPLTTTIYHFTFFLLPLACQHKQHKQCKKTHQRYCSRTVITFLIIHYQILRHQECAHSLGCNQYWKPFSWLNIGKVCTLFRRVPCRPYSYSSNRSSWK